MFDIFLISAKIY